MSSLLKLDTFEDLELASLINLDDHDQDFTAQEKKEVRENEQKEAELKTEVFLIENGCGSELKKFKFTQEKSCAYTSIDKMRESEDGSLLFVDQGQTISVEDYLTEADPHEVVELQLLSLSEKAQEFFRKIAGKHANEIITNPHLKATERIGQKLIADTVTKLEECRANGGSLADCSLICEEANNKLERLNKLNRTQKNELMKFQMDLFGEEVFA